MMRRLFAVILGAMALLGLAGCDVHELPVGSSDVAVKLHLAFDTELPDFRTVIYPASKAEDIDPVRVCYYLHVYRGVPGDFEREPYYSEVWVDDYDGGLVSRDFSLDLKAGRYLVQVWMDFMPQFPYRTEPYYTIQDFEDIRMVEPYAGADEMRVAYCGQLELPLETILEAGSTYEVTLPMERPMARYRFLATDIDEFLQYWAKQYAQMHGLSVKPDVTSKRIEEFSVRVVYPQYLPSAFSLFQDRPVDAATGVSFTLPMKETEDGKVDLGFDWVFQGADEGVVVVALEFYDQDGEYIATFPSLEVPLLRGHLTTVEGRILTAGVNSGIAIDPTFDGEFTIEI